MEETGLMTSGNIYKQIIRFSIPLILGNFFQLMYNTVDSIVVGNFVGKTALAAVGAGTPIINLMIAFFMGLSTGAGVVVAKYYGARDTKNESLALHTFTLFSVFFGIALTIIGIVITPALLKWIDTPSDALPEAITYLQIYFAGSLFVTVYNAGTGILQALGDSKHPLYFLIASSLVNVVLDLYFVTQLHMGVAGAAIATIISQAVSMILVLYEMHKSSSECPLRLKQLKMDLPVLKEIITIGVPSGIQGMVVCFSNVLVMSYVNTFGSSGVAGFTSANKYDNFIGMPINSLMLAITTFASQNLGAKQYDRVKQGVHATLLISIVCSLVVGILIFFNAELCIRLFSSDEEVIQNGVILIHWMCPFYFFLCFHQTYSGALRAANHSNIPMLTSIFSFVIVRQIFLGLVLSKVHDISIIAISYSFTWALAALLTGTYYYASRWLKKLMETSSAK